MEGIINIHHFHSAMKKLSILILSAVFIFVIFLIYKDYRNKAQELGDLETEVAVLFSKISVASDYRKSKEYEEASEEMRIKILSDMAQNSIYRDFILNRKTQAGSLIKEEDGRRSSSWLVDAIGG